MRNLCARTRIFTVKIFISNALNRLHGIQVANFTIINVKWRNRTINDPVIEKILLIFERIFFKKFQRALEPFLKELSTPRVTSISIRRSAILYVVMCNFERTKRNFPRTRTLVFIYFLLIRDFLNDIIIVFSHFSFFTANLFIEARRFSFFFVFFFFVHLKTHTSALPFSASDEKASLQDGREIINDASFPQWGKTL